MKNFRRIVAVVILLCMMIPLVPAEFVRAAVVTQRYVLDTDGIDAGATYLIVNTATAGSGNALRFHYDSYSSRDFQNQTVTVKAEDTVRYIDIGFANEENCTFQFSAAATGKITHGNYSINLDGSNYATGTSGDTMTFNNLGGGQYQIQYSSWFRTYYLRYANSDWTGSTTAASVYLYKLTEHIEGYDVNYDGNGHTSGTLPQGKTELSPGESYTVLAPTELRKDIGQDTWLFLCWNTAPDGSGTEYAPGEELIVDGDITLYAEWYQQTKHTVSMMTYLNGELTDVEKIAGVEKLFYAKLENTDTYIPLEKASEGVYSTKVADNGTYEIFATVSGGDYEPVHGHKVVIYNQDGTTECMHYSVSYDAGGGVWTEGQPAAEMHHDGEPVIALETVPTKEGSRFMGWKDAEGKVYQPGAYITTAIDKQYTLTAVWEDLITVTVNITIDHNYAGGDNFDATMHQVVFNLLRQENGVNLPVQEQVLTSGYTYDQEKKVTTYQIVFENMPQGLYHAAASKSHYETEVRFAGAADEDQVIDITLRYAPDSFDLSFDVVVDNEVPALMPQAVNVKISCWGYDEKGNLGWYIITQQEGNKVPSTVLIDENGVGSGFFPVWEQWSDSENAFFYRVEVTSFVMPDGTILPATGDGVVYRPDGSGLYTATVAVEGGRVPHYPPESQTTLPGAYWDGEKQVGDITVTVDITPMTVTFDAGDGLVNGEAEIVLNNQYLYPDLNSYTAVPNAADRVFVCWTDENGEPVENLSGQFLTGNVTYKARYNENIIFSGDVMVDAHYQQGEDTVTILERDRAKEVLVVLQRKVGDAYNDVSAQTVTVTYEENSLVGTGSYEFTDIPNDGSEYRVQVLILNYASSFDNNADGSYSADEAVGIIDSVRAQAEVDIHLEHVPDSYLQDIRVDATQIAPELRPTGVLAQILYRDLGDVHNFEVISQHTVDPYGMPVDLQNNPVSYGAESVWNWHTNGAPYEYQVQISTVYGNVPGAYTQEGTAYTNDSPFTVEYGPANNYLRQSQQRKSLTATLVPKEYPVILDLNLQGDTTPVYGLDDFMVDDGTGNDRYVFVHTWSYAEKFTAYPYREGFVFMGWESPNTDEVYIQDGTIHVGSTLAREITLVAQWEPLSGTDYTVRYLELNTDKVLKAATVTKGAAEGDVIMAVDKAVELEGYVYAGATVGGKYTSRVDNPFMTITNDPAENLMVIYYLPDGSDGYTEQVESNLSISKSAVLENNGTYTITMDTYTKDNPITTRIQQNTPLDVVLVLDQSGSLADNDYEYLNALKGAVNSFVEKLADHGRHNDVDHRIAIVGYASNEDDGHSSDPVVSTGGKDSDTWVNTGVFDSNGEYHLYNVQGFNYTELTDVTTMTADGTYYTKVQEEDGTDHYLLLRHHDEYRHLITEEQARVAVLQGQQVYGYVFDTSETGSFVPLTRNSSGLWLYGDRQLYSETEFFTYHTDVWTHRHGTDQRQIHAYGVGAAYTPIDGHTGVYTRQETTSSDFQQSIYRDALIPVSVETGGAGGTNPGLIQATQSLGADGATRASYGMEMANAILAANPAEEGRVRMVVMFTDGEPGFNGFSSGSYYDEAVEEANNAIYQANIAKNTYNALVYTIGLYESAGVDAISDVAYYMNAISSNYPDASNMDDIKETVSYVQAADGVMLENNGKFFVRHNNTSSTYYTVKYGSVRISGRTQTGWYYTRNNTNYLISSETSPVVSGGKVGSFTVYQQTDGYADTTESGYYTTTESPEHLAEYFQVVLRDITSKITTEIILEDDTILRDIMNQGLVLTEGTVISVSLQEGNYNLDTDTIDWAVEENGQPTLIPLVSLDLSSGQTTVTHDESGVTIHVYNLEAENATNPDAEDYHPHTVDVTGYNYAGWYISPEHPTGYKMVVTITRVEATEDVQYGRTTTTNQAQSGLWLPADENGNRELLLPFRQPTTIFVERAYVLDYGKTFTLSNWYFDDQDGQNATAQHVDCDISNGMNWFDPENPNTDNLIGGQYGNTQYGNVHIDEQTGEVTYSPTSMNWGGYDQFYIFGNTWRRTVKAQSANENGNLWNKVTVIPANNIYYEDSFITTEDGEQNGFEGFVFTGDWEIVGTPGNNTEQPEHSENLPYGSVHGWTDSLGDDVTYTDGTAHATGLNGEMGASAEFTFTGTGVEVYTRTNAKSGMVIAMLYRIINDGNGNETLSHQQSVMMDNLAASGDYYHIPTLSFRMLPYGTYKLKLIATAATTDGVSRYEYYIDGVRILNPLGNNASYQDDVVVDAYELETNSVFTEVRDILLDYGDFNADIPDDQEGKMGAVFIDQIKDGQGSGNDQIGTGQASYELGTFEAYGPKNEVYLRAGQAIVLRVAEGNNYYMGFKSLTGKAVTVNVSGIEDDEPTAITLQHTTDMYYQVTPVNGYIVVQNGSQGDEILSITNLRTTNLTGPLTDGGVLGLTAPEAIEVVRGFSAYMAENVPMSIKGDVSGDGKVTNEDVAALMWHALFPEENPIKGDGDFNRDGVVNNADVVELLWYALFPLTENQ